MQHMRRYDMWWYDMWRYDMWWYDMRRYDMWRYDMWQVDIWQVDMRFRIQGQAKFYFSVTAIFVLLRYWAISSGNVSTSMGLVMYPSQPAANANSLSPFMP